jgi:hypothetical protein
MGKRTKAPWTKASLRQKYPDKKPPNIEIILQSCFILGVILKELIQKIK